jgi:DNA-binding LacI/PurR family transcriptional regulator
MKIESSVPKYYQLKQALLKDIAAGKYPADKPLPSENDLIAAYSISNTSVRRALNELVKEEVIYAVQGKGRFVFPARRFSHKPRKLDSGEVRSSNNTVAFIIPTVVNGFYAAILRGVMDRLEQHGFSLAIYNSDEKYDRETSYLSKCIENPVRGVLIVPSSADRTYRHLFHLERRGIPVVLIDRVINDYAGDYVTSNHRAGAKRAVQYLIKQGHRDIVYIAKGTELQISTVDARREGYLEALKQAKIPADPVLQLHISRPDEIDIADEMRKKVFRLLATKRKFTAVFAASDWVAQDVFFALKEKLINVPKDVSLVGYDNSPSAERFEVPLTTVGQDVYGLGDKAAEVLLERMATLKAGNTVHTVKQVLLPTKLIIRKSVRMI